MLVLFLLPSHLPRPPYRTYPPTPAGRMLVDLAATVPDGIVCFFVSYLYMDTIVSRWNDMGILQVGQGLPLCRVGGGGLRRLRCGRLQGVAWGGCAADACAAGACRCAWPPGVRLATAALIWWRPLPVACSLAGIPCCCAAGS